MRRSAVQRSVADHCQVVVHVDASSLRGGAGRSDLPIETVKRLTCDGSLITVVEDEHGTPLDVGRKQRTVIDGAEARALVARSRLLVPGLPTTRATSTRITSHHWANGGDTSLDNLTLLCTHHHTLLHEGGFTIQRDQAAGSTSGARTGG